MSKYRIILLEGKESISDGMTPMDAFKKEYPKFGLQVADEKHATVCIELLDGKKKSISYYMLYPTDLYKSLLEVQKQLKTYIPYFKYCKKNNIEIPTEITYKPVYDTRNCGEPPQDFTALNASIDFSNNGILVKYEFYEDDCWYFDLKHNKILWQQYYSKYPPYVLVQNNKIMPLSYSFCKRFSSDSDGYVDEFGYLYPYLKTYKEKLQNLLQSYNIKVK